MAQYQQQASSSLAKCYTVHHVFQCSRQYCKQIFNDFEELRDHHAIVHGNDDGYQLISCHVCRANFDSQLKLDLHRKTHENMLTTGVKTVVPRKCPHCPIHMKTKTSLDQHIRGCHGGKSLPIDLRKAQQPTARSPTKLTPTSKNNAIRLISSTFGPVRKSQADGAIHASDIMKISSSATSEPSVTKATFSGQSAENLMEQSSSSVANQYLFKDDVRIVKVDSSQIASTSSKPASRGQGTRGNNGVPKTYDCRKCGESFKNRCSLTLHEMKHKQKESDFHCPAAKCYRAFNTRKKLRGHIARSHSKYFGADVNQESEGVGFEALMKGEHFDMNSSVDSCEILEDGSLQTPECTTEILIIPRDSAATKDVEGTSGSTPLVRYRDTKIEVVDGEDALGEEEEIGGGGLVIDEGMIDERAEEWTVGIADDDEVEEEKAVYGRSPEESFESSPIGFKSSSFSSSSASARIALVDHEFERLDEALSSRHVLR